MLRLAGPLAVLLSQPALAQEFSSVTYGCDRGVKVPAT